MNLPHLGPTLIALCVGMAVVAGLLTRVVLSGPLVSAPAAIVRASAQLAAVAGILAVALQQVWTSTLLLTAMFAVAAATATRRSHVRRGRHWVALAVASGVVPVAGLLLSSGVVPLTGVAMVPTVGIVMGGAMTATATAGRRALSALDLRRDEVEAAVALGAAVHRARLLVVEPELRDALIPNLDQARTAGVVTLPGAFVGVLLATGSPAQAGAAQIVILVSLLLAQVCSVATVGRLIAHGVVDDHDTTGSRSRGSARLRW